LLTAVIKQTFYDNIDVLTDQIYVLTKIIELPLGSAVTIRDIYNMDK
jgi:hypothetical protein